MTSNEPKPLSELDYQAALKKANAKSNIEQLIQIDFHVSSGKLLLPYKKGIELLAVLQDALFCKEYWSEAPVLKELDEEFTFRPIAQEYIDDVKVAKLLNIPYNEAKKLREVIP